MSFWRFIRSGSRGLTTIAIVAGLASGACSAALLGLINTVLSRGLRPSRAVLGLFVVLTAAKIGTNALASLALENFAQRALADLCRSLVRRVLATPLRRLEELGAPRILTALVDDVATIGAATRGVPTLAINFAVLAGCSIYLAWLSWQVMAGVMVVIVLGMVGYHFLLARALRHLQRARDTREALFGHFHALTDGTKELKLHSTRRRAFLMEELEPAIERLRRDSIAGRTHHLLADSWNQFLFYGLIGMLIFGVLAESPQWETLSGYVLASFYLMGPVWIVIEHWPTLTRGELALQKVEALQLSLAGDDASPVMPGPVRSALDWERLELESVRFAYEGTAGFVFGPVDFTLKRGEIVFLIGSNGSGKSTFVKILTGLYSPHDGEIRIDGRPITDANREWLHSHFSVVFSDCYLFQLLGLKGPDLDDHVRHYLAQLELDDKVDIRHGALSTTALSQGEVKRLALLTAFLEDRPIYVFDEWTANQDPHYRAIFFDVLLPDLRARGKTVVIITHDDRYFHRGDRVVAFEDGALVV